MSREESYDVPIKNSESRRANLFLHEEITLLALRDEQGSFQIGVSYDYAIGGAVLAELLLKKRLKVDASPKKKLVEVISSKPVGESVIDECLQRVTLAKRRASLQTWISRFAGVKRLRARIGGELCRQGIVRIDEKKVLWLFTRRVYPEVNPVPERRLIDRMSRAISSDIARIDPRTTVIISLAKSAGLLEPVFGKKILKRRKARIEKILKGEMTGKATQEAIQAMQVVLFTACVMPTITATTGGR